MRMLARFAVLALVALAFWVLPSNAGPAHAAVITVNVGDNFYANSPSNTCPSPPSACVTNINVGDTVHWVWMGSNLHSTTSDTGSPSIACGVSTQPWDSGIHGNGFTCNVTFNTAGSFSYHCSVHGTMHGTIVVTQPVGGAAELPNVAAARSTSPAPSGGNGGLMAGALATAAAIVALGGAVLYARKRRSH